MVGIIIESLTEQNRGDLFKGVDKGVVFGQFKPILRPRKAIYDRLTSSPKLMEVSVASARETPV